jgi:glycosyltransferase involved in cell wall biosynthesis
MKKVSVIIPSYNKAEYTRRTVESVLAQTYKNIEILVIDDGSKDNTKEVMAQYAGRIHFIEKANGGACSARNEGIRRATGEYVTFLDCDDLYVPQKIERCVSYLEANPDFGFVYTGVYFIDENDAVISTYDHPNSREGYITSGLILGNFICNSTIVVRQSVLQKAGFFDENFFTPGDWDLWLRFSVIAQAGYIADPLTKYRVIDNYIFNRLELARKEELYMLDKFFKANPDYQSLKGKAYSNFHLRFAQCAFLKKERSQFWKDCKEALQRNLLNIKVYVMCMAAIVAPAWLTQELTKRIVRR